MSKASLLTYPPQKKTVTQDITVIYEVQMNGLDQRHLEDVNKRLLRGIKKLLNKEYEIEDGSSVKTDTFSIENRELE